MRIFTTALAALITTATLALGVTPTAHAAITVNTGDFVAGTRECTIGAVGHDGGIPLALTAGHCFTRPGQAAYNNRGQRIGVVVSHHSGDSVNDWTFIRLDPGVTVGAAPATTVSADAAVSLPGMPLCKEPSLATGKACGTLINPAPKTVADFPNRSGDSGAAVTTAAGLILVGIVWGNPGFAGTIDTERTLFTPISTITRTAAEMGVPGAHFTPGNRFGSQS